MGNKSERQVGIRSPFGIFTLSLAVAGLALLLAGCQTRSPAVFNDLGGVSAAAAEKPADRLLLREGDSVRVSFPGAPNLNTAQAIRRDGKLALPLVGEVQAAGLSPSDLEKKLLELYGPQLQTKEVSVALESSAFPIYVSGAVLRPGKVVSDRPITALEAVMEAGGFDHSRANTKSVRVIRNEEGRPQYFSLNLKAVLDGKATESFKLKPSDIIYVPEKFSWF